MTGATSNDVANAIWRRLNIRHPDLCTRCGDDTTYAAVEEVAEFHAGAEELGTSDIGIMVREVLARLNVEQT